MFVRERASAGGEFRLDRLDACSCCDSSLDLGVKIARSRGGRAADARLLWGVVEGAHR